MSGRRKTRERVFLSEDDQYLFAQGTHYDIYKKLGAHPSVENGREGMSFAVWAPHASQVHVIGDFNGWDETAAPMRRLGPGGIYHTFLPGVGTGALYKFLITAADGRKLYKADPFANQAQLRPETASVTADLSGFRWSDGSWMRSREEGDPYRKPLAIYECHIGSWKRHPGRGDRESTYGYREFADSLVEYLRELPFTHVELMGIAEHPFDGSWGYQVTGYYAPTSRYGTPEDFRYLVNTLHKNHIGVILDWVPAHFPRDAHGLADFDGEALFENPDPRRGEHPEWGTKIFDYSRGEVKNFLIANALYWIREFHVDGLRVDAVASMLYLDYGRKEGEWLPNQYGGKENLDAVEFFRHLNTVVRGEHPGVLMIAEESTAWPGGTAPASEGGLYFSYKWNMGWMHDFCEYMKLDPYFRKGDHHGLTFAMSYNESEHFILPLSHDEVVHLKCSMVNKMPGCPADKYANLRAAYAYMFGHSGKKLLFMGQEFGQEREWSESRELDWFLLQHPLNAGMLAYMRELVRLYRESPCLYQLDREWSGFEWVNADDADRSIYSFIRKSADSKKQMLFVLNMTPVERKDYCVGVPRKKTYRLLLNSAEKRFGGNGQTVPETIQATKQPCDGRPCRICFDLPAYGALIFGF